MGVIFQALVWSATRLLDWIHVRKVVETTSGVSQVGLNGRVEFEVCDSKDPPRNMVGALWRHDVSVI